MNDLTHTSFFAGIGGIDLGLERAGWRTVAVSEIDPYACAILSERWPDAPNLGDITALADGRRRGQPDEPGSTESEPIGAGDWRTAVLWSGGFPCQDLSVAGKRAGLAGERSGLAFAFLDLVSSYRPSWILLENVPGLLSSHAGKDLGTLLGTLGELGYGWAYRILDARYFGVAQRRRRLGTDRAAEVLFESESSGGDIETSQPTKQVAPRGAFHSLAATDRKNHDPDAASFVGTLDTTFGHHGRADTAAAAAGHYIIAGPPSDAIGVREAARIPRRLEHIEDFRKAARMNADPNSPETWVPDDYANTINTWDQGDIRTVELVVGGDTEDDARLPRGLDSHRYRVLGNAVAVPVAEWIGRRLRQVIERDTLGVTNG